MSKELFKSNESIEMYLETVYRLHQDNPNVKMSEVAAKLGVSKPSCHTAMAQLKDKGWIVQARYGDINLTQEGIKQGEIIFDRHKILTKWLMQDLGLDFELAEKDACRMEHVLSQETLDAIKEKLK